MSYRRLRTDSHTGLWERDMQRITLRLPEQQIKMIEMLVQCGEFPSTSEAIRTAIRDLIDQRSVKLADKLKLFEQMQNTKSTNGFLRMHEEL